MNLRINRNSSKEDKKNAAEAVYELLADFFFDKVSFISYPFSQVQSGGYTGTTLFNGSSRITNTSDGKFLITNKRSRTRLYFYASNAGKLTGYVLSPVLYDAYTSLNTFSSMDIFRAYVGIKIVLGKIYLVVKETGKNELIKDTGIQLSLTGASETYKLEMKHGAKSTDVYIDDKFIATLPSDFTKGNDEPLTYLPLLSPAISSDGTAVNIVIENFQYIQDK